MKELWAPPEHPNLATALGGYVGSGAPLVAGFELAAVVFLLTTMNVNTYVPLVGPAILAMVVSACLMVFSIRYGFWAVSYWTTPAERLMWNPAAAISPAGLDRERRTLAARLAYFTMLRHRAEHLFELGLIVFLLAVALMLIPARWYADGAGWRWAATAAVGVAFGVHLLWTVGKLFHDHAEPWYGKLAAKRKAPGDRWDRRATFVSRADNWLVNHFAVIWPPVKPAKFEEPGPPETADLLGLRNT